VDNLVLFTTLPGWHALSYDYANGSIRATVKSMGARTNTLFDWAKNNDAAVDVTPTGFFIDKQTGPFVNRPEIHTIIQLQSIVANLLDRLSYVLPGNNMRIGAYTNKGKYSETEITITFSQITPTMLRLIGNQFKQLPLILSSAKITTTDGNLSGTIQLKALGN
jgi:hypothetical protein